MEQLQTISYVNVCFIGAGLYLVKKLLDGRFATPVPPGPIGWPVLGNIFDVPREKPWLKFAAFGKKYGDISSISILGTRYVFLSSNRAVSEVLEKQSAKASDRPHLAMAGDLVGWSRGLLFINNNDRFRQYRRLLSRILGTKSATSEFYPIVAEETRRFVLRVVKQPDDLQAQIRTTSGAVILKVIYGYSVQESNDPLVNMADATMETFSVAVAPGKYLVDFIPALRYLPEWFPGTGFLQDAKKYRQQAIETIRTPHEYVKEQMAAGTVIPSFTSTLMSGGVTPEEEDIIMWASMNTWLGGSDTVVSALYGFFLAMVIFPGVQAKAQAELDTVVGNDRLPSFEDRDSLPYINAVCKEVLRWHTVGPLAMPHVASEDIYSDGLLIPKGSYLIGNSWSILHDEDTYPDPYVFRPERWLVESPPPEPTASFGYGRRICPGMHLADASIFSMVATSLSVLKISRVVIDGVEVIPELDVTSGTVTHPQPFACKITARSSQAQDLLRDLQL